MLLILLCGLAYTLPTLAILINTVFNSSSSETFSSINFVIDSCLVLTLPFAQIGQLAQMVAKMICPVDQDIEFIPVRLLCKIFCRDAVVPPEPFVGLHVVDALRYVCIYTLPVFLDISKSGEVGDSLIGLRDKSIFHSRIKPFPPTEDRQHTIAYRRKMSDKIDASVSSGRRF